MCIIFYILRLPDLNNINRLLGCLLQTANQVFMTAVYFYYQDRAKNGIAIIAFSKTA